MISPKRSAGQLPGDPRRLNLEYRTWHFVGSEGDENGFDEWEVSVRSSRYPDRPKGAAARTVQHEIGSMRLFRLRMDERFSPFPFSDAEAHDTELSNLVLGVYDLGRGGYRQEFRDTMTTCDGDLLVLFDVRLDPAWRGFGLGPVLAAEAVWTLADGCSAVITHTHPTEFPDRPRPEAEYRRAVERIAALWESVGFRRRAGPLGHLLDPRTDEARDLRNERRRDLDALAGAWRASLRR
ncbi:hypothetical protein [Streptomyces sp. OM5714]|uniref:hypothetical protein n=1 Tax=Streptomyces sp. OM5714 TaxID=2602736 RepID=UPI0013DD0C31|nr:hypothetical protein [Streptomyces sp. OM5714]KAF2779457.1 hypothetical protein STPH1_4124 [Streptomyces sp. OM5714]